MKHKEALLVIMLIFVGILFSLYGFRTPESVSNVPTKTTYVWKTKTPTLTPSKTSTPMPDTPTPTKTYTPTSTAVSVRNFSDDWEQVFEMQSNCVDFDEVGGIWSIYTDENDKVTVQRYYEDEWQVIDVPEDIVLNNTCPHEAMTNDVWFYNNLVKLSDHIYHYEQGEWQKIGLPELDIVDYRYEYFSLYRDSLGRFWFGLLECGRYYSCLHSYHNGSWHEVDIPFRHVTSITGDEMGNVWVGGRSSDGLALYNNQNWEFFSVTTLWGYAASDGESSPTVRLYELNDNEVIATLYKNPLTLLNSDGKIQDLRIPFNVYREFAMTIFEDHNQRIWFTCNMDLLGGYDLNNQQWVKYQDTPENYRFYRGINIFKDKHTAEIWFLFYKLGSEENGLYRLKENIPQ